MYVCSLFVSCRFMTFDTSYPAPHTSTGRQIAESTPLRYTTSMSVYPTRSKRLLILLPWPASPFMQTDIQLLRAHLPVEVLTYAGQRARFTAQVFRRIASGQVGAILFWFAVPSFGFSTSLV